MHTVLLTYLLELAWPVAASLVIPFIVELRSVQFLLLNEYVLFCSGAEISDV